MSLRSGSGPAPRKPGAPARPGAQPRSEPDCPPAPAAGTQRPRPFPELGGRAGEPWDRRGRPIKFPLAAAGGDSPSRERVAGSRRTAGSCLFPRRLPAERRRRRALRRTRSPASDLEATASVNMHTHTLAHGNFVVIGGPTPADLHPPLHTHNTWGAESHRAGLCPWSHLSASANPKVKLNLHQPPPPPSLPPPPPCSLSSPSSSTNSSRTCFP